MVPIQEQKWRVGPERKKADRGGLFAGEGRGAREKNTGAWISKESKGEGKEMLRADWGWLPGSPGSEHLQWDKKLTAHGNKLSGCLQRPPQT